MELISHWMATVHGQNLSIWKSKTQSVIQCGMALYGVHNYIRAVFFSIFESLLKKTVYNSIIEIHEKDLDHTWVQQEGSSNHTANEIIQFLQ